MYFYHCCGFVWEREVNWRLSSRLMNLVNFQVSRLIYTNSGMAILALASNAVHKLWKWQRNERNASGKVLGHSY